MMEDGGKFDNEDIHKLYPSLNIIMVIKPRRILSTRHITHTESTRNAYKVCSGNLEGKKQLGRPRRRG